MMQKNSCLFKYLISLVVLQLAIITVAFSQVEPSELERQHGILRIKLNNYYGSSQDILVVNQYHDSTPTDTVISRLAMFDLGAIRNWPKGKVPERWAGFHYYSTPIQNRDVTVLIWDGPDTMKLQLTNNNTLRDHNLSIPFSPGIYTLHLPHIKDVYTYNKNIEYITKKAIRTYLERPERSGLKEQAFIYFETLKPFKITPFKTGNYELYTKPFKTYDLNWLQYARNTVLKQSITTPIKTLVNSNFWPDESNELCVYNSFVQIPRLYLADQEDLNNCGPRYSKNYPLLSYPDYFKDCSHEYDSLQKFIYDIALLKGRFNSEFARLTKVYFTLISDSLVSVVFHTKQTELPAYYLKQIATYQQIIDSLHQQFESIQQLKPKKKYKAEAEFYSYSLHVPKPLELADLNTVFQQSEKVFHYRNKGTPEQELNQWNVFSNTKLADSLYQNPVADTNQFRNTYLSINLNPKTLRIYDVKELLPDSALEIIYQEMLEIKAKHPKHFFNEFQYDPALKRHFVAGFTPESLLIYYGNEGEFGGNYIHEIPLSKLGL